MLVFCPLILVREKEKAEKRRIKRRRKRRELSNLILTCGESLEMFCMREFTTGCPSHSPEIMN